MQDVPAAIPKILHCMRAIWALARFYNTPEHLTGLLRHLADDIIHCCAVAIPLDAILAGEVDQGLVVLQEVS